MARELLRSTIPAPTKTRQQPQLLQLSNLILIPKIRASTSQPLNLANSSAQVLNPPSSPPSAIMDALSNEIDENIIQRLGLAELNALSKSSKYYRALTEPFIYKELVFHTDNHYKVMQLFLTILGRQNLARYIHKFTLTNEESPNAIATVTDAYHTAFWDSILLAKETIGTIAKGQDEEFALR
jgi:hypothetical protein